MALWCGIITLFPEMFKAITDCGITRRAVERGLLEIHCWDPRDFAKNKHRTVDDRPYGGGPGMVMGVYPLRDAIHAAKNAAGGPAKVIYLSPQGQTLDQDKLCQVVASEERLIFIAGRYEGIDERIIALEVDEEWSIGDYVLSGGELAIMVAIDAMTRWVKGALGHEDSAGSDSFADGLLGYPQYTRPETVEGLEVPAVLLEGNHALIEAWRLKQKLGRTWLRRKTLFDKRELTPQEQTLLQEFIRENERKVT